MMSPSCKYCEFHRINCHSDCEVYAAWAKARREETNYTTEQKRKLNSMWDYGGRKRKKMIRYYLCAALVLSADTVIDNCIPVAFVCVVLALVLTNEKVKA